MHETEFIISDMEIIIIELQIIQFLMTPQKKGRKNCVTLKRIRHPVLALVKVGLNFY